MIVHTTELISNQFLEDLQKLYTLQLELEPTSNNKQNLHSLTNVNN